MEQIPLTWNEALSGVFGSISLAAWIFLLVPQLVENYRQGHADGISLAFLVIWFLGDALNLAGAAWAHLVPTIIAIAVYFCFADVVLILQCLYYRALSRAHTSDTPTAAPADAEQAPLLNNRPQPTTRSSRRHLTGVTEENMGLPGSRRRSSAASRRSQAHNRPESVSRILDESTRAKTWIKNTVASTLVIMVGVAGWTIAWRTGAWKPTPPESHDYDQNPPIGAEILGYGSAILYLGARIPQIVKNQRERSCDGLSLLFFLLSLMGNFTYGAGILFHSVEKTYVITNLPWLIGSLGTMVEDAIIFAQFSAFGEKDPAVDE